MNTQFSFNYYYGAEAEQFTFFRIPKLLMTDEKFKGLSCEAKLLYGLMLDRMSLSVKNGWVDEENRVYIYYSTDNIMDDLGCASEKCTKILRELDTKKGIGLIEKKRQGFGKPDIIYVKNFIAYELPSDTNTKNASSSDAVPLMDVPDTNFENRISRNSKIEEQEIRKSKNKKFESRSSENSEIEGREIRKSKTNYTNSTNTEYNNTNLIYPNQNPGLSASGQAMSFSGSDTDAVDETHTYMDIIKTNVDYGSFDSLPVVDKGYYEELFLTICDVVCVRRKYIIIGGEEYPYELVKSRFLKLRFEHLEYVVSCLKNTTTKIVKVKSYMIAALYNAPATLNTYYQNDAMNDMYGGGI